MEHGGREYCQLVDERIGEVVEVVKIVEDFTAVHRDRGPV